MGDLRDSRVFDPQRDLGGLQGRYFPTQRTAPPVSGVPTLSGNALNYVAGQTAVASQLRERVEAMDKAERDKAYEALRMEDLTRDMEQRRQEQQMLLEAQRRTPALMAELDAAYALADSDPEKAHRTLLDIQRKNASILNRSPDLTAALAASQKGVGDKRQILKGEQEAKATLGTGMLNSPDPTVRAAGMGLLQQSVPDKAPLIIGVAETTRVAGEAEAKKKKTEARAETSFKGLTQAALKDIETWEGKLHAMEEADPEDTVGGVADEFGAPGRRRPTPVRPAAGAPGLRKPDPSTTVPKNVWSDLRYLANQLDIEFDETADPFEIRNQLRVALAAKKMALLGGATEQPPNELGNTMLGPAE